MSHNFNVPKPFVARIEERHLLTYNSLEVSLQQILSEIKELGYSDSDLDNIMLQGTYDSRDEDVGIEISFNKKIPNYNYDAEMERWNQLHEAWIAKEKAIEAEQRKFNLMVESSNNAKREFEHEDRIQRLKNNIQKLKASKQTPALRKYLESQLKELEDAAK